MEIWTCRNWTSKWHLSVAQNFNRRTLRVLQFNAKRFLYKNFLESLTILRRSARGRWVGNIRAHDERKHGHNENLSLPNKPQVYKYILKKYVKRRNGRKIDIICLYHVYILWKQAFEDEFIKYNWFIRYNLYRTIISELAPVSSDMGGQKSPQFSKMAINKLFLIQFWHIFVDILF